MSRTEYMRELDALLQGILKEEREEAMQYYNDYFDEAGEENEEQVIRLWIKVVIGTIPALIECQCSDNRCAGSGRPRDHRHHLENSDQKNCLRRRFPNVPLLPHFSTTSVQIPTGSITV